MLTMQDAIARLSAFWAERGCLTVQPMNTEVGAGTLNAATFLRVLGPEPWKVAYVEPSVRPDDSRYGENPNRVQTHHQFQVILKPEPGDAQEQYLDSLVALGIDVRAHDVRFVEDNWASPALGAWGLGWEVWLDGMEITQFTYFQQAGGHQVDPVAVEITYGLERILMALQKVTHVKDIAYADGVSYGEIFGQSEYQMSRYYLDDADVAVTRNLLAGYAAEAERMIDAELPVPAHGFLLKCSHAFNVLDARGAVSTTERAAEFGRMRRFAANIAQLWMDERAAMGHPLGQSPAVVAPPLPRAEPPSPDSAPQPVVLEIGTEELATGEARAAADQVERLLDKALGATRLPHGDVRVLVAPRRIAVLIDEVAPAEPSRTRTVKGPKVSVAFDAEGQPSRAAAGFARSNGTTVQNLGQADYAGTTHLVATVTDVGRDALTVLGEVLSGVVGQLRSGKNMRWRDEGLSFTRPIRWLLALYGDRVIPAQVSSLVTGRTTRVHRTAEQPFVEIGTAADYLPRLAAAGVVVDPVERRDRITAAAVELAATGGGTVDLSAEAGLIDQITYLVEQPNVLLGSFEERYLDLPEAVLATVMRKHQRYLPIRGTDGRLSSHFVVVANGEIDAAVVRAGNEAVLRARYEDAAFFHRADLDTELVELRDRLTGLTFADRLGSMLERADRISAVAHELAPGLSLTDDDLAVLNRARELTMFDHGSRMVTEMTSLAGTMAREYATAAGEPPLVAQALYELELPRHAGDATPATLPGALLALASRADLLTGLTVTVGLPTGSSDPAALRRAALGIIAIHRSLPELRDLSLAELLAVAGRRQPVEVIDSILVDLGEFLTRRLEQLLVEEGRPVDLVRAALIHADRPQQVDRTLDALTELMDDPGFAALREAVTRVGRIVPAGTVADYDPAVFVEPAELALHEAVAKLAPELAGQTRLDRFAERAVPLAPVIATFFDTVLVMADDPALRAARLGLLATVASLADPVLDWQRLP